MKRVLLDGDFFADWEGSLDELAEFSGVELGRLSFEGPGFKEEAAALNADYQADIAQLTQLFGTAALAGGASQAAKQAAISEQYAQRKAQYLNDYNALRTRYEV